MTLLTHLFSRYLLAQVYGSGSYGSLAYGSGVIHIGPLTLPATGATLAGAIFIAMIAIGVGLLVWLRQRSKS
jgi:LPXTG-motif cell wall-anchored protein